MKEGFLMDDCIFCKIIKGEIPSITVYEDDDVKAFLDISQATKGHTLLVPKKHVQDIFAYDDALAQKVLTKIPMVAQAIKDSDSKILGLNIVNNNGEVAYQSVFHSHIHFIPRYGKDDSFSMAFSDNSAKYDQDALNQTAAAIKAQFN